jgi:two-component system OmpR family response regulator
MPGYRVLLVDDEQAFLDTLAKRLRRRKLDVLCANGGRKALEIVAEQDVDFVILDIMMSDLSGMDTLKAIKKVRPTTVVIMLTGIDNVELAIEAIENGAFDHLVKPVNIGELVDLMEFARAQ